LKFNKQQYQNGFSLAVVLMLVTVMGGFLVGITGNNRGSARQEAEVAGWELAEISRAARIYARNQISLNPNLVNDLSPSGTGPQDIFVTDLITDAMLPSDFLRQIDGSTSNALGQPIRIILANFPIDGDPLDPQTVPTAYVYVESTDKVNGTIIQDVVQAVRGEGVGVSAPIFSGGNNVTGECDGSGEDTAILWDTGCLNYTDFTTLTGGDVFEEGDFVIPTWRSVNFDTRAIMRFAHPESTGLPTMLTALEMGVPHDCTANPTQFIDVPSDSGTTASDICGALDDSVGVDNRRDIINTSNIETSSVIVDPQAIGDTTTDVNGLIGSRTEEAYAMSITGTLNATGDAKVYDGDVTVGQNLTADKNIFATNNGAGTAVSASIGLLDTGNATATNLTVTNTPSIGGDVSVQNDFLVPGNTTVSGSVVAEQLQMNAGADNITVIESANMLGTTVVREANIDGTSPLGSFDYVTGEFNANDINLTGNVSIRESLNILGGATLSRLDVENGGNAECLDDCPQRDLAEFCNNITGMSYDECMVAFQ
jgi:hypothetical protein